MHPKDIQRYIHTTARQANTNTNERNQYKTIIKPTTCAIQSEELYKLNQILREDFPTIYELIGGIEGLLMCVDKGSRRLSELVNDREKFYDSLTGESYQLLEEIATTEHLNGNDVIAEDLDKEFISFGFAETLLKIADAYRNVLNDEMRPVLQKQSGEVTVVCVMQSPLKGVYFVQIDPD